MPLFETLLGPLSRILDKAIPDPEARDRAKLELLRMNGSQDIRMLETSLSAIVAEATSADPWTSRARPGFLYVIYAMILWAIPVGVIAAFSPRAATAIAAGMTGYLQGLPEPLYALFGTGYLGYSAMRQWGKVKGAER
ncbi:holin family protein [Novosphingobium colocasiae]|uniref:holin family protein n=1 Tax=Novosphingobium colocasiae TaxID=1256513 RepID=UPI0035B291C5